MAWTIEYDEGPVKDLKKLDRQIQRDILNYMEKRIAKADDPRTFGKPLRHSKFGCGVTDCGTIASFASFRKPNWSFSSSASSRAEARPYTLKTSLNNLFAFNAGNAIIAGMATLTIRQLDQKTKTRLRVRAAHHGRSMEEEAREILRAALTTSPQPNGNLAEKIRRRFAPFGGVELSLPKRDAMRKAPRFKE